ncbi:calcitonin gene-related peptide type 1 receptor isoform X2 [Lingula anatina]|uniref:Calcitonin gene-related peptide type 1 receptor isoform X2 n=1 Tax=Lingula anatina TaxID=7574 RepID=A0A1S3K8Z3_LINAN|nr:calcitonin gene-related peptide type 1 receptor isoform X2 [Lingula anatina]|eukprot:XP_013418736.1 calcitonin gene-related peptide type 1 receptor isoform X2 [Lingula anatina]
MYKTKNETRYDTSSGSETNDSYVANVVVSGTAKAQPSLDETPAVIRQYENTVDDVAGLKAAYFKCATTVLNKPYPTDGLYCYRTWDGWACWDDTPAGTTVYSPCPQYVSKEWDPLAQAYKECTSNGTWWRRPDTGAVFTKYFNCMDEEKMTENKSAVYVYLAGYGVSTLAILISLVIFFAFKQLHCDRITIHKNLFVSYVLTGVGWIIYYLKVPLDHDVIVSNPFWCQGLHVLVQYLTVCNYFWMFCEGLYLHTIIVVAFTTGKALLICCCVIGWGLPAVITFIYASVRGILRDATHECWIINSPYFWILNGTVAFSLLLNLAFLCNIVRVLMTKLRAVNSPDTNQGRKAVRATLILIPLLGLQFVLFPFTPSDSQTKTYYLIASAFVTSFQGFFVALIYCFLNSEVLTVLRRKWEQYKLMRGSQDSSSSPRRPSSTYYTSAEPTTAVEMSTLHNNA